MVQRQADPDDIGRSRFTLKRSDEIALFEHDRAAERIKGWPREAERGSGKVDAAIMRNLRAFERANHYARIPTGDVEEMEWSAQLIAQDLAQPAIGFAMEQVIVIDHLAISVPVLLEQRRRGLVDAGVWQRRRRHTGHNGPCVKGGRNRPARWPPLCEYCA